MNSGREREREREKKKDVRIVRFESIVIPRSSHIRALGQQVFLDVRSAERKKKVRLVWKIGCAPAGILFTGERHRYRGQAIYQPIVFGQGERELREDSSRMYESFGQPILESVPTLNEYRLDVRSWIEDENEGN